MSSDEPEPWISDHHLVGNVFQRSFLSEVRDEMQSEFALLTNEVKAVAFLPEDKRKRRPALWRGLIHHEPGRESTSSATTDAETPIIPSIAVDCVSADWQQAKSADLGQNSTTSSGFPFPCRPNLKLAGERLQDAILDRIYDEILPQLVLKAALEEVRAHFLRQAMSDMKNAVSAESASSNAPSSSLEGSVPQFYHKHPSNYFKTSDPSFGKSKESATKGRGGSGASTSVTFTPNQLVHRIKQGCTLAWSTQDESYRSARNRIGGGAGVAATPNSRRASSRIARQAEQKDTNAGTTGQSTFSGTTAGTSVEDARYFWDALPGGTIAAHLLDSALTVSIGHGGASRSQFHGVDRKSSAAGAAENDAKSETIQNGTAERGVNPYLIASNRAVLEWLGKKTSKLLSNADLQKVFPKLLPPRKGKKQRKATTNIPATVGGTAATMLSSTDWAIWKKVVSEKTHFFPDEESRLILDFTAQDDNADVEKWDTSTFGRTQFSLRIVNSKVEKARGRNDSNGAERAFKERKNWDIMRYREIHSGYAHWASWMDAILQLRKNSSVDSTLGHSKTGMVGEGTKDEESDFAIARELEAEEGALQVRRTTRRGGDNAGVFYGSQSHMTQKQLMESILRVISQKHFGTIGELLSLVPDESHDPLRRLRTSLGRTVWKRNQMVRMEVNTEITDAPVWVELVSRGLLRSKESVDVDDDSAFQSLLRYLREVHTTEILLRALVIRHMSSLPVELVATAADERPGTTDSMDASDFHDPSLIHWDDSGHRFIGSLIYRPSLQVTEGTEPCYWYKVVGFAASILTELDDSMGAIERPPIGLAKDCRAVDRRMRFKATLEPEDTTSKSKNSVLVLTEAQVHAGIKAGEIKSSIESRSHEENPFVGATGVKIALYERESVSSEEEHEQLCTNGSVVGYESSVIDTGHVQHKILFLPDVDSKDDGKAVWLLLQTGADESLSCTPLDLSKSFVIQQFDYAPTSQAFKECRNIISTLQKHPKSGPFQVPVDPIALNIPQYFDVIKEPMDLSTVSAKLDRGEYAISNPKDAIGRTAVARMLNGPFRADLELIFDNAIQFNPSDDWIYQAAVALKKLTCKKIEQTVMASEEGSGARGRSRHKNQYVDEDSDVDMYVYESDKDEDYDGSKRGSKRKRSQGANSGEEATTKAIERATKLQKALGEAQGLRGPFAGFAIKSNASLFSIPSSWHCRRASSPNGPCSRIKEQDELVELVSLRAQIEETESSNLRRSTRSTQESQTNDSDKQLTNDLLFWCEELNMIEGVDNPRTRLEVEKTREYLHEKLFAKLYHEKKMSIVGVDEAEKLKNESNGSDSPFGSFVGGFPPYLGRVIPHGPLSGEFEGTWEIRSPFALAALRWVLRGLVASSHLTEVEPITDESLQSGVVMPNNVYWVDPSIEPFDILDQREMQRRKRGATRDSEEEEEEVELSEYEKLRAERVARNADRLKSLGLA